MTAQMQPTNKVPTVRSVAGRPPLPTQVALTPKELLGIVRRHVFLIAALTVVGVIVGGVSWLLLRTYRPRYTAVGVVQVLPQAITDPLQFGEGSRNKELYDQWRNSKVRRVMDLNTLTDLSKKDSIRDTKWFKQFEGTNWREWLKQFILGYKDSTSSRAVKNLKKHLRAWAPRDDIYILVSMECGTRAESKLIVKEMLKLLLQLEKADATADLSKQLGKLTKQQTKLVDDLDISNDEMRKVREGTPFGNIGQTAFRDYLSETLGAQQTDLSNLQNEINRLNSTVEILRIRAESPNDQVIEEQIEQDPIARNMRDRIATMEPLLAQLLTRFGENHRRVKEIKDALKQQQGDLQERRTEIARIFREASYRNAQDAAITMTAELESQKTRLQELKAEHKEMSKVRAGYLEATTLRDEKQLRRQEMTTHIKKLTTLVTDPQISKVQIRGSVAEPLQMSSPKFMVFLPGGFIIGLLAGLGLAFAIELLNDLVRSPSDVVKHLRAPLLGMICHVDEDPDVSSADLAHVVHRAPYSIMSECYRQFRANLKLSGRGENKKILLITSGGAGDGKTTIAANLATTLVAENSKVLLIDANFRRPMSEVLFPGTSDSPPDPDWCLSNYLSGQCQADNDLMRFSGIEDLDIIDSGPVPASPAEMLGSARMRDLLAQCRNLYDYVIIDSPPLLVSDAKALAAQSDGTILVFDAESTHRGAAQRALRELREINATVVGTVLMRVKARKGGYFQEVYKSYHKYQRGSRIQAVAG